MSELRNHRYVSYALAFALSLCVACTEHPTGPTTGVLVVIGVADEVFRVALTDPHAIEAARRAQAGAAARIPNGQVRPGTGVNVGWNWHLEEVEFAEFTTEVCDGRPSDVEREGI